MKTIEKFENGMSIVQLEERFEMQSVAKIRNGDDLTRSHTEPYGGPTITIKE